MTKIQETLVALPEEKKALFIPAFGDVDKFYTTVYLIARNDFCVQNCGRVVFGINSVKHGVAYNAFSEVALVVCLTNALVYGVVKAAVLNYCFVAVFYE